MSDKGFGQIRNSLLNSTASLAPSAMDLFMAVPRLAQRAGSFAFLYMPEHLDNLIGKMRQGGSVIAEATSEAVLNATEITKPGTLAESSGIAPATSATSASNSSGASSVFSFQHIRNLGGIFSYMTSRWALATFAVVCLEHPSCFRGLARLIVNRQLSSTGPSSTLPRVRPYICDGMSVLPCILFQ